MSSISLARKPKADWSAREKSPLYLKAHFEFVSDMLFGQEAPGHDFSIHGFSLLPYSHSAAQHLPNMRESAAQLHRSCFGSLWANPKPGGLEHPVARKLQGSSGEIWSSVLKTACDCAWTSSSWKEMRIIPVSFREYTRKFRYFGLSLQFCPLDSATCVYCVHDCGS